MFSLLECTCIGFKNIHVHLGIFPANLSKVSDLTNQIMIPESGIMDEQHQNKVYRLPAFFLSQACLQATPTFPYSSKPMENEYESMYYSVWDNILKNHIFIRAHPSLVIKKLENLQTNVHVWVARHFSGYQNISL